MIKVITIFLTLTTRIEASIVNNINSPSLNSFFSVILRIVDDSERFQVISPNEEESIILEFKTYWLMSILIFKNHVAKQYYKSHEIDKFIETKSKKYLDMIRLIIEFKSKGGFSEKRVEAISKSLCKFCEMIYYYIVNNDDEIIYFKENQRYFNMLTKEIQDNKNILVILEKDQETLNCLQKIYKMTDIDYIN